MARPKSKLISSEFINKISLSLRDTWREIRDTELTLVASSLAYTTILAIVPLIAVSFSVFKAFGGLEKLYPIIEPFILQNLAQGTDAKTLITIREFIGNVNAGALGTTGLVLLILTSMSMLSSAEKAINRIWKTTVTRHFFQRITTYWFFITIGPLTAAFVLGASSSAGVHYNEAIPGILGLAFTVVFFTGIYKWIPNRSVKWIPALAGAVYTTVLWNVAEAIYGLYTSNILPYSKIYGSLAAIPIIILWIFIMWVIILSGAAVSAGLQKRMN